MKKQSQFSGGQIGVNTYMKGYYGKIALLAAEKKQSQFKAKKADFISLTSEAAGSIISVRIFGETPYDCRKSFFQGEIK